MLFSSFSLRNTAPSFAVKFLFQIRWKIRGGFGLLSKLPKRTSGRSDFRLFRLSVKPINRGIGLLLRVDRDTKHNEFRVKKTGCSMNERFVHGKTSWRGERRCDKKDAEKTKNLDLLWIRRCNLPTLINRWHEEPSSTGN